MKLKELKRLGIGILCASMLFLPVKDVNATGTTYWGTGTTAGNNNVIGGTGTTAGNNNVVGGNNNTTDNNNTGSNNGSDNSNNNTDNNQQTQQPENTDKPITSEKPDNNENQNNNSNSNNQQSQQKPENTDKPIIADKPDEEDDKKDQNTSNDKDDKDDQDSSYENQNQNSSGNLGGNVTKEENPVESVEKEDDSWKSDSYDNTGTLERGAVEGVSSSTEGYYAAKGVNGCAVVTNEAQIKQDYGLTDMENVYAKFSDLNAEDKPVSAQMLQMAVNSQGGEIGPMINIDMGKMNYESYRRLSEHGAKIQIAMGIPESFFDKNMTYGVVCVRKDGKMEVLRDMDSKQSTVTVNITGGVGAYALYRYSAE